MLFMSMNCVQRSCSEYYTDNELSFITCLLLRRILIWDKNRTKKSCTQSYSRKHIINKARR